MDVDIDVTETVGVKTGDITGEVTFGEKADVAGTALDILAAW